VHGGADNGWESDSTTLGDDAYINGDGIYSGTVITYG
jgi:hypothetical protein